jgi:pilus assembly protein CpaC
MKMTHAIAGLLLGVAAPALLAAPAQAQSQESGLHAGTLEVPINKSQVVTSDRPISRAMIGSAEIADVLPISNRSVYVLGKKTGTTSLTLYDATNRVIAVMDVSVGPDVEGLRTQLGQLIPGQTIDARLSNGSILLTGLVNDPGAAGRAAQLAKAYAGENVINLIAVGASQQVMLEVKFAEVSRQLGERLGVNGFGLSTGGRFRGVIGEGAATTPSSPGSISTVFDGAGNVISRSVTGQVASQTVLGTITDSFGILSQAFRIGSVDINATLNMLERRGLSKTLAEPTLVALSGERASFLAGGEFPIPVVQSNSGAGGGASNAITIEFKPFGVSLGFTPTVLSDKVISMIVEPEVSSIDPTASVAINGLIVPGLQTRRASTTVEMRDGESFVIAGLLRKDFATTVRQLPVLGSLPILGSLFRSSSFQKGETELLIVVTPRLVAPIRPDQVRLPTDRIDDPKASDVLIDGEGYRPKALAPIPNAPKVSDAAEVPGDAKKVASASELSPTKPSDPEGDAGYEF